MASDALNPAPAAGVGPAGEIADYLVALDDALTGPRRTRADVLDEIHDGLIAAADRRRDQGMDRTAAMQAALLEFGPPEAVAGAFAGELAMVRARRLLAVLLLTGPLVGMWWLLLLAPHRWPPHPAELVAVIPVLPVAGATIAGALSVLAATGRLAHHLPALSPRRTVWAAHAVAVACLMLDVTMLAQLAVIAATAPGAHPPVLMVAAAAASLARLPWVGRAAVGCRHSASRVS